MFINTDLIVSQYMLGNQENAWNETKANQYTKGMILVQPTLIEGLKVKGAFQGKMGRQAQESHPQKYLDDGQK